MTRQKPTPAVGSEYHKTLSFDMRDASTYQIQPSLTEPKKRLRDLS
jgi:hypothetical protein